MRNLLVALLLITIVACQQKTETQQLTGDLFFSNLRIGNYYNQPDSVVQFYEVYFSNTDFENGDESSKELRDQYKKLKDLDLLYKPFVEISLENESVVRLYLTESDYDQIKIHKRLRLQEDNKKVKIECEVEKIDDGLYTCKELLTVELVDGETLLGSGKLRIEDYN
ncbi:MAG: hypothetical protein ACFCUU_04875 [Cyclobacteriaceae bacterium]